MYMKTLNEKNVKELLSNLCCSKCRNDFDIDSLKIKSIEGNIYLCELICQKCGMDFGDIVFSVNHVGIHPALEVIEGPAPISADDVLDAHKFIKNNL